MQRGVTISCAARLHNGRTADRPWVWPSAVVASLLILLMRAGCAPHHVPLVEVPSAQLAAAEPATLVPVGRGRISFDRPLPARLVQRLSEEFDLIVIRQPAEWEVVQRQLQLPDLPRDCDLQRGCVLGIAAHVGRPVGHVWPIRILAVRTLEGTARIEAALAEGLYQPLLTAAFVDLVYVTGVRRVASVQINTRQFSVQTVPLN